MAEKISKKITYGELEKFLISLGFEETKRTGHTVFLNNEFDSLITLPRYRKNKLVESRHLLMIKVNLAGKGIPGGESLDTGKIA
ncbi:MAG: hypothetical protein GY795_09965 [Desulfobacterales bacterium]|nr:hypothetical protein [Desulfobacterales bacterium]